MNMWIMSMKTWSRVSRSCARHFITLAVSVSSSILKCTLPDRHVLHKCLHLVTETLCVGQGLGYTGKRIAPLLLPSCPKRQLEGGWWSSRTKSLTTQSVKDNFLLQSQVRFVGLACWKEFTVCWVSQINSVFLTSQVRCVWPIAIERAGCCEHSFIRTTS